MRCSRCIRVVTLLFETLSLYASTSNKFFAITPPNFTMHHPLHYRNLHCLTSTASLTWPTSIEQLEIRISCADLYCLHLRSPTAWNPSI
jgi:hypothetical protein